MEDDRQEFIKKFQTEIPTEMEEISLKVPSAGEDEEAWKWNPIHRGRDIGGEIE
jgi:hypothetical protein